ncbi:chemotaxis protein MotB [Roseovarius sp. A21]|uniref:Chemotaxis protein MotB n=1 Tax=Roseovarius bejariae TaxID=2576383 RepID=A0A844CPS7_9RHOB|nr:flagellar motor protein MotB [Roseovarius bejariae]MRU15475.1 chemotaxis protein MotB [Roseovarius bejariae]
MSAPGDNAAPVIIKRKKVTGGDGHHGGAWKVAYADFVTAMMAFFLLMWLLNATTEKQRKGIADYFSPTIPINRISGGGDGSFGGESVFSEEVLPQNGTGATNRRPTESRQARGEMGVAAQGAEQSDAVMESAAERALKDVEDLLSGTSGESNVSRKMGRHILTRLTDEGLLIEVFDLPGAQLFRTGTAEPTDLLYQIAGILSEAGALVQNGIAVEGHIQAAPVVLAHNPVWDLSAERANAMRQLLQDRGLDAERMQRVTGHADREPVVRNPMAMRNNRVEVIFLRSDSG